MNGNLLRTLLAALLLTPSLLVGACGTADEPSSLPEGHNQGSGASPGTGGSGAFEACTQSGVECSDDDECCSGFCDPTAQICSRVAGACSPAGESCGSGLDCCNLACLDGKCSDEKCTSDGESCDSDEQCCGGNCTDGTCAPLNEACRTGGNECSTHSECCSNFCDDGLCSQPSYCTQTGDACTSDAECCAGLCAKDGASLLGVCQIAPASGAGGCLTAGQVCSGGATYDGSGLPTCGGECCSRACFPHGKTGVLICQPPSGCNPTGELCREDSDCCGSEGLPDGDTAKVSCSKEPGAELGRCDAGNACTPAGGICRLQDLSCNANANCCAGNVLQEDTCKQDNLGIPRCLAAEVDCSEPANYVGKGCATSADCCNLPCVPNPEGDPQFVCGESCVDDGGDCTTTADCCRGFSCLLDPGSTKGTCGVAEPPPPPPHEGTGGSNNMEGTGGGPMDTCAQWGQECSEHSDCCSGVPCTDGVCMELIR